MIRRLIRTTSKAGKLLLRASRKVVLKPGEALLICRMAWWVSILSFTVKCCSLPRALRIVTRTRPGRLQASAPPIQDRLARAIDLLLSTDILFLEPICWKRAAILHRYLSQNGITTRILFGVRNDAEGRVSGHAWLEADGKPFLESTIPNYVITYSFPSDDHYNLTSGDFRLSNR
jgi:Transglutaminase-like superfamily